MRNYLHKLTYLVLLVAAAAGCTPTANEVLQEQLASLDTSQFISFMASVEDDKGNPISGATVTLETLGDSATTTLSASTDANGKALFSAVPAGGHLLTVSATDHLTASGIADFTWAEGYNYTVTNDLVVGIPVTESAIIPLYPSNPSAEDAATITGTVTVESDLTNTTPETVEGLTVVADLSSLVSVSSDGLAIRGYQFRGSHTFGCATTDANGDYTMLVPAQKSGTVISLIFPEFEVDQRVVANEENGVSFDRPEALSIPTAYGPELFYNASIPAISGVWATFPEPPAAGSGFVISNVTMIPRDWSAFFNVSDTQEMPVAGDGVHVSVSTWGAGYDFSPTVEVDDANSDVTITVDADLGVAISGYTLTSSATGLAADTDVSVSLFYEDEFGFANFVNSILVTTDGGGAITQAALTTAINQAIDDEDTGFGDNLFKSNEVVDSIYMVFPGAGADGSVTSSSRVHRLSFGGFGTDYLSPTVSISGGNPSTALAFSLTFGSNWEFTLDNSGVSVPYVLLPDFEYEYREVSTGPSNIDYFTSSQVTNPNTTTTNSFDTFVEPNAVGNLVLKPLQDGDMLLYTSNISIEEPRFLIENQPHQIAEADVTVSTDGEVTGLAVNDNGEGYNTKFEVTIAPTVSGLPGSGADVTLVGGEFNGVRFDWFGGNRLLNPGSGYAQFANQILSVTFNAGFTTSGQITGFQVQPGETVVRDIDYGTGRQSTNIN